MLGFNRKNKIILFGVVAIILVLGVFLIVNTNDNKLSDKEYINKVLKTDAYSYLPEEAKEYVAQVYEESGNVLLTEKNKKVNIPYLNPRYVEYLEYKRSNKIANNDNENIYDVIPKDTVVDYLYSENRSLVNNNVIESKFDLRSVNGNNYVTPIKDQGGTGLCWAFATIGQVESYLLLKEQQTYNKDTAQIFSERQIDYATAYNGVDDYFNNKYGFRRLKEDGGRFENLSNLMQDGLSLVDVSFKEFDDQDEEKLELSQIYNYDNSLYEVNATVNFPILNISELDLSKQENIDLKNNYLNIVKNHIMNYGGAYVGTQGPTYSCSAQNIYDNNYYFIVREDEHCTANAGHAMQIIGWDDNYKYKYCIDDEKHFRYTNECKNYYESEGAWILKNSWGTEDRIYDYVYLAYDSLNSEISLVTDMNKTKDKIWNNKYDVIKGVNFYSNSSYSVFDLDLDAFADDNEMLSKFKIDSPFQNVNFYLLYSETGDIKDVKLIDTINTNLPGLYTLDLYNKNIDSSKGKFYFGTDYTNDTSFLNYLHYYVNIKAYTKSDNDPIIITKNATYKNTLKTKTNDDYYLYVYSDTKNIPHNDEIDYKLFDENGNDLSSYLSYEYNIVSDNNVRSKLKISKDLTTKKYILKSLYKNVVKSESNIFLREIKQIEGNGTKDNPYVITTPDELAMINSNMSAYYVLGNDIDLTNATQEENGTFYNDGKGWIPIGSYNFDYFDGFIDGKGYMIKGLYKKNSDFNGGLFNVIAPSNNLSINVSNLNLKDFYIHSYTTYYDTIPNYTSVEGVLASKLTDALNDYYYLEDDVFINVNNVSVVNSYVSGYAYTGGLFGSIISTKKDSIKINNIFTNNRLVGSGGFAYYKGALAASALIENYFEEDANLEINNVLNIGEIDTNVYFKGDKFSGGIIGMALGKLELSNVITSTKINHVDFQNESAVSSTPYNYGAIIGTLGNAQYYGGLPSIKNIYYVDDYNAVMSGNNFSNNNIIKKKTNELKDINLYTNWKGFNDIWNIDSKNDISRIPMLNFVNFDYFNVYDIKIYKDISKSIFDFITPNNYVVKTGTSFKIEDESIASIDKAGNIKGLKEGKTTLHIESDYDGYINDIPVSVQLSKYVLTFNSNCDKFDTYTQRFSDDENNLLPNKFKRTGYKFKGWNSQADGKGINYTDEQSIQISGNMTLYALWEPIKYKVRFTSDFDDEYYEQEFVYDKRQKLKSNEFIRTGYKFSQWISIDDSQIRFKDNEEVLNLTSKEEIIWVYASWLNNKYYIKFISNGGKGIMDDMIMIYDYAEELSDNVFTKDGYIFKEWNTKADGKGISYKNKQKIKNLTSDNDKTIVLYAIWEKVTGIHINIYDVDQNKKYIKNIKHATTVEQFKKNIVNESSYDIKVNYKTSGNKNYVYTGGKTKIYKNNILVYEYTNIINGDINGDGFINSADLLRIRQHLLEIKKAEKEYFIASDINSDNDINSADLLRIRQHLLGIKTIG